MAPKSASRKSTSSQSSHDSHVSLVTQANYSDIVGLDPTFLRRPRIQGSIWNVSYGRNYTGKDTGNVCVAKWVRSDHRCHHTDHFRYVHRTANLAAEVLYNFQRDMDTRGIALSLVKPVVLSSEGCEKKARKIMVEPYLSGMQTFNWRSGRVNKCKRTFNKVVQALSHYSYVWSSGKFVLCGLQGAVKEDRRSVVLTGPTILSRTAGTFGCTDLGGEYVDRFFERHVCSGVCEHLPMPKNNKVFFRPAAVEESNFGEGEFF